MNGGIQGIIKQVFGPTHRIRAHVPPRPATTTLYHLCFLGGERRICADEHGSHTEGKEVLAQELSAVMNHLELTDLHKEMQ